MRAQLFDMLGELLFSYHYYLWVTKVWHGVRVKKYMLRYYFLLTF